MHVGQSSKMILRIFWTTFPGHLQSTQHWSATCQDTCGLWRIARLIQEQLEEWFLWTHQRLISISYRNFKLAEYIYFGTHLFNANLYRSTSDKTLLFCGTPLIISCCRILQLDGNLELIEFNNWILHVRKISLREQKWLIKTSPANLRLELRAPDSQFTIFSLN